MNLVQQGNIFSGDKSCPVCERSVENFLPLPSFYREHATRYGYEHFGHGETISVEEYLCPLCGASDRERLYALYLKRISFREGSKVLHFAPESSLSQVLKRRAENEKFLYRTVDLKMDGAQDKADITNMTGYNDSEFDFFICSMVLEHVEEDHKAVSELYRITRDGGSGILMAPIILTLEKTFEDPTKTTPEERWRYFGQFDHVRLYSRNDYINMIENTGFRVERLNRGCFGARVFEQCGLKPTSALYIAKKRSSDT